MAYPIKKEKAQDLRRSGKSIGVIASILDVSKSTVSFWCKDIRLSATQLHQLSFKQRENSIKALLRFQERRRTQRIEDTKKLSNVGRERVGKLTVRDLFILGLGLYWAEGYKKGNEELGLVNSDPAIIKTYIAWLQGIYGVKIDDLIPRVSLNLQHIQRVNSVLRYWSNQTKIPLVQFTKTSFVKTITKKQYPNHNNHFGTLRVKVRRGTKLRRDIMGSLEALTKRVLRE